jgi:hypothetical protein
MDDFLIDIPFKANISLKHVGPMLSAVSILMRSVIDTAHHWSSVSLTPPTTGQQCH